MKFERIFKLKTHTGKSTMQSWRKLFIVLFIGVNTIYMGWRIFYTLPFTYGGFALSLGLILLVAEVSGFFDSIMFYLALFRIKDPKPAVVKSNQRYPEVDVFIATYNEPVELLYKTINACLAMDYPDRKRVHIYLCDDGRRQSMRTLAQRLGVHYLTRPSNEHAKAGNLNEALRRSSSPLIVTFDADMMPRHEFLMTLVPYFMENPKLGFIQTPQAFYNPDTFQFNLYAQNNTPNEQDLFFTLVQAGRSAFNAAIYAGSNTVLRRDALSAIGGFVTGTITEDIATGMRIQAAHYESLYYPKILAVGLTPSTIEDVYNQRIRWANGVVQTFRNDNPLTIKGLSFMQRLFYLNSLTYWFYGFERLIFFMAPLVFGLLDLIILDTNLFEMLFFWGPFFLFNYYAFQYFTRGIRSFTWSNIYEAVLAPQIAWNMLKELFGIRMKKFKVTPKETNLNQKIRRRYDLVLTQLFLLVLSIIGIVRIVRFIPPDRFDLYLINLFWLIYNSYVLLMSVFYASERPTLRSYERFGLKFEGLLIKPLESLKFYTVDVSEQGLSLHVPKATFIDPNINYALILNHQGQKLRMKARLVRTRMVRDGVVYSFKIIHLAERNLRRWWLWIYDREPLSTRVTRRQNPLKRIVELYQAQMRRWFFHNRKDVRLDVNRCLEFRDATNQLRYYRVLDANFQALRVEANYLTAPAQLSVPLDEDLPEIPLVLDADLSKIRSQSDRMCAIYRIDHFDPLWEGAYMHYLESEYHETCIPT